jgi:GNAT superfamily N-acetyltransferase
MSLEIIIREATRSDLPDLARLNAFFNQSMDTAEQIGGRLADPQCVEIPIVAEMDNRIVGFAGLRVVPYIFYEGAHAELTELFVEGKFRRQGVGRALIAYAENLAKARNAGEMILHTGEDNQGACAFYLEMGYRRWEIVMGKTL